jgi:hypothetical protein
LLGLLTRIEKQTQPQWRGKPMLDYGWVYGILILIYYKNTRWYTENSCTNEVNNLIGEEAHT